MMKQYKEQPGNDSSCGIVTGCTMLDSVVKKSNIGNILTWKKTEAEQRTGLHKDCRRIGCLGPSQ